MRDYGLGGGGCGGREDLSSVSTGEGTVLADLLGEVLTSLRSKWEERKGEVVGGD